VGTVGGCSRFERARHPAAATRAYSTPPRLVRRACPVSF
jgi:hypothetical protein